MKKILTLIFALTVFQLTRPTATLAQLLKDVKEVALMKANNKTNGLIFGDNTAKALQIFGQPDKISDFYSEMDEATFKIYHYGGNKLYFLKDRLDSYELSQSGILVGKINGDAYQIGDKIISTIKRVAIPGPPPTSSNPTKYKTEIIKTFHNYPLSFIADLWNGISYKVISSAYLKIGETTVDAFIQLLFDNNDRLIFVDIIEP